MSESPDKATELDPETLRQLRELGGSDFLSRLAERFEENVLQRLETAHIAWDSQALDDLREAAHSIKSSAGNIGATHLHREAAALEHAIRNGENVSAIGNRVEAVEKRIREALVLVRALKT